MIKRFQVIDKVPDTQFFNRVGIIETNSREILDHYKNSTGPFSDAFPHEVVSLEDANEFSEDKENELAYTCKVTEEDFTQMWVLPE